MHKVGTLVEQPQQFAVEGINLFTQIVERHGKVSSTVAIPRPVQRQIHTFDDNTAALRS